MPVLLQYLLMISVLVAVIGFLHLVPNRVVYWLCVGLSAFYAASAIVLQSGPAVLMAVYFALNAYLRVALTK